MVRRRTMEHTAFITLRKKCGTSCKMPQFENNLSSILKILIKREKYGNAEGKFGLEKEEYPNILCMKTTVQFNLIMIFLFHLFGFRSILL